MSSTVDGTNTPKTEKKISQTRSAKAGLLWPVSRVHKKCASKTNGRVGAGAPVYLSAVVEVFANEILTSAAEVTAAGGRKRIAPQDLISGIRRDRELNKATKNSRFVIGVKNTKVHDVILSKKELAAKNASRADRKSALATK